MNEKDLQYFKVIGKIHTVIASAKSFSQAVTDSLKIILENSMADYAVIWQTDENGQMLRPTYWICPVDLSSKKYSSSEGIVGRVFKNKSPETIFDFKTNPDKQAENDFNGINISSLTCLPLETDKYNFGVIQFIKAKDGEIFNEDEIDACALLTAMAQMEIEAGAPLPEFKPKEELLLTAKNVHKYFKNGDLTSHVLKGVNFDVYKGEFLCLLGESGCGKSTMLNIIGGLLDFEEGNISFMDKDISKLNEKELTEYRRNNIGFIFQSYNLMPNLNAKQNLDLIGELVDNPLDSNELLKLVGLEDRAKNYPSQLSGGQQQRIAIARAMIKKPKIILADEPTAALDYQTSIEVLSVMEEVVKNGTTLILITHNEEITKMADRVIRFRDGKTYEVTVNRHPLHATDLIW